LVCPNNLVGTVDVYLTTHHGMDMSGPATIVHALKPRVAIMNNGATKGGAVPAWQVVHNSPGLQDLWQLHYAVAGGRTTMSTSNSSLIRTRGTIRGTTSSYRRSRMGILR
jgi:competence protein ComEC